MGIRQWFCPPRHVLAIFMAVGFVSAAALVWLMGSLLRQDEAVETQHYRENMQQAAERTVASMQTALSDLELALGSPLDAIEKELPEGVIAAQIGPNGISVSPKHALVYYPEPSSGQEPPASIFGEGQLQEQDRRDLKAATEVYAHLAADTDKGVQAGALMRLARVRRKLHDTEGAIAAYNRLSQISAVSLNGGLPAELIARIGRASAYDEAHRSSELRNEAAALQSDLRNGRWQLNRDQYTRYWTDAGAWLGTPESADDAEATAQASAVDWLWEKRSIRQVISRQLIDTEGGPVLIVPRITSEGLAAAVAGKRYLTSLCGAAVKGTALRCVLSDSNDRIIGEQVPSVGNVLYRSAATSRLPWTTQFFPVPGTMPTRVSRLRSSLLAVSVTLTLVWIVGAAFIVRAIGREARLAQLQSDFVAAVSHEFRSPLSSLCQISEMLSADRLNSEDRRREAYDVLERESGRLRRLVEGLLDFQRFEAGAAAYHFEPVKIGALIRSVVTEFQPRCAANGGTIELADGGGEHLVRADREALARAIWNLLDNAFKYSPEYRTVWVDVEYSGQQVTIAVRDRGMGIPLHEQRRIFEKFVRGEDSMASRIKGTGIGLAMVRQIVRAHGGEIMVASRPGEGSRFAMVFPARAQ